MGLVNYWMDHFSAPPNRCSVPLSSKPSKKEEKLTLNYLLSAFLLYGVGICASILAFILECILFWRINRTKVNASRHIN